MYSCTNENVYFIKHPIRVTTTSQESLNPFAALALCFWHRGHETCESLLLE